MFIKNVVRAPYVCTVPSGGLKAVKCYPDAMTFYSNKKRYGYSKKTGTLIVPNEASSGEISVARKAIESI